MNFSGSGWMGGVGAMQAAVAAPVVTTAAIGSGPRSFADAMQQSGGTSNGSDVHDAGADEGAGEPAGTCAQETVMPANAAEPKETKTKADQGKDAGQSAAAMKVSHAGKGVKLFVEGKSKGKAGTVVAKPVKPLGGEVLDEVAGVAKAANGDVGVTSVVAGQPAAIRAEALKPVAAALDSSSKDAGMAAKAVPELQTPVALNAGGGAVESVAAVASVDAAVAVAQAEVVVIAPTAGVQSFVVQAQGVAALPVSAVSHAGHGTSGSPVAASKSSDSGEVTVSSYEAATPNKLEIGLQGGALGWLKVRAEMGTNGEVNAYLRGTSVGSTNMLQAQAPGIAAYLGAQDVVVRSVQVEAAHGPQFAMGDGGSGVGGGEAGNGSSREQARGDGKYDGALQGYEDAGSGEVLPGGMFFPQMYAGGNGGGLMGTGSWLSVRA